jgi:hypothetical protein
MALLDSQDHSDLANPTIPLYPPLVLNPDLIERSRQKAMQIASLGADGIDIEELYPEAYNEMRDDL